MAPPRSLVVCVLGGARGPLELPESVVSDARTLISGGERSLYELAVAAAVLGVDVELRGAIDGAILAELTDAAGAAPRTGLPARRPTSEDVVVVPEAIDLGLLAAVHLSPARGVIFVLGPPGLTGWDFVGPVVPIPDPWTVPIEQLARPETFRVMAGLGFELWTGTLGLAAAGDRAGVPVTYLGTGTPVPFLDVPDKTVDVAVVEANRWHPQAEAIAEQLPGVSVLHIPAVPHVYSLAALLAPARILLWPSRVEGRSRIAAEARSVGTVPVALDTNPFALAEDHTEGAVLVPELGELRGAVLDLLADPARLAELQVLAVAGALRQKDWPRFVSMVDEAFTRTSARAKAAPATPHEVPDGLVDSARSRLFDAVGSQIDGVRQWSDDLESHLRGLIDTERQGRNEALALVHERNLAIEALLAERRDFDHIITSLGGERDRLQREVESTRSEVDALRSRRSMRLADAVRKVLPHGGQP